MILAFSHPGDVAYNGVRGAAPPGIGWTFLLAWPLVSTFLLWLSASLKRVRVADGALLVSNYRREWRVPFGLVTHVSQNRWINVRPITLHLRADVGFGTRIVFLPPTRLYLHVWREDPEVEALRRLIGLAAPR